MELKGSGRGLIKVFCDICLEELKKGQRNPRTYQILTRQQFEPGTCPIEVQDGKVTPAPPPQQVT